MTKREQETRRRRRLRREARAKAELESVVGGPLFDIHQPFGTADPEAVQAEADRRMAILMRETVAISHHFAHRCWVPEREASLMFIQLYGLLLTTTKPPALC